jgi:rubrerythrin
MKTKIGKFSSFTEVLDFAISREKEAYLFYQSLAGVVKKPELAEAIRGLANEEEGHRIKLESVKAGKATIGEKEVGSLNIADYAADVGQDLNMSYVDLLALAMKKENLSYRLYTDIAELAERDDLRDLFLKLAQEEAGHKLRFEFEYDLEKF